MRRRALRALCLTLVLCLFAALPASAAGETLVTESRVESWSDALLAAAVGKISPAVSAAPDAGRTGAEIVLSDGDTLTLGEGDSTVLTSGSAAVRVNGVLVNASVGARAVSGNLNSGQLYIAADATAVITASGSAVLTVWGGADVTKRTAVFSDVPSGVWYYDYVYAAVSAGLIDGMSSSIFEPESGFTVAQAIKIAACLNQYLCDGEVTLAGDSELWYRTYVSYAVENGIVGAEYSAMTPEQLNAPIDRRDFAVIFYNATPAFARKVINTVSSVPDVPADAEGAGEIYALYRAGIINGMTGDGYYNPDTGLRRNEAATIVARIINEDLRVRVAM